LHLLKDRRAARVETTDHKVVRPGGIRTPGSRYFHRAPGPRRISAGGLFSWL